MAEPKTPTWTAPRRIYLDKAGAVISEGDATDPVTLLAAAGATIRLDIAIALGLAQPEGSAVGYSVTLLPGQSVALRARSAHSSAQLVADSATDSATLVNTTQGSPPVTLTKALGPQPLAASVGDVVTFAAPRANAGPVTVGGN